MWSDDHIQFELAWRNGDLTSVARQNNALAGRETGITLFLYYHDGDAARKCSHAGYGGHAGDTVSGDTLASEAADVCAG